MGHSGMAWPFVGLCRGAKRDGNHALSQRLRSRRVGVRGSSSGVVSDLLDCRCSSQEGSVEGKAFEAVVLLRPVIYRTCSPHSCGLALICRTLAESLGLSCRILERSIKSADNLLAGGTNNVGQRTGSDTGTGGTIIVG